MARRNGSGPATRNRAPRGSQHHKLTCLTPRPDLTQRPAGVIRAELIGNDICRAEGITARCSAPVLRLCRSLLAAGLSPDTALEVFRNGIVALRLRSLADGARLEINSKGTAFVCAEAVRAASYAAIGSDGAARARPEGSAVLGAAP